MKFILGTVFFSLEILITVFASPHSAKLEGYCKPEKSISRSQAFHLLHSDICGLVKDVLSNVTVNTRGDCAHECLSDKSCAGYNFKIKQRKRKINCQISGTLNHDFHKYNCKKEEGSWKFYESVRPRKVDCTTKTCENSGVLIEDPARLDIYTCQCTDGYIGDSCETAVVWEECNTWTWLTESNRNINYVSSSGSTVLCDNNLLTKWYRFGGGAGTKLSTTCIPTGRKCASHGVSWLNGAHPSVNEGRVTREVCFGYGNNCCYSRKDIKVVNCGSFYIYKLVPTGGCSHRYCGTDI